MPAARREAFGTFGGYALLEPSTGRQILLRDCAGALDEKGRHLFGGVRALARMHPPEIGGAAYREKQGQPFERRIGERPLGSVPANQRIARRRIDAVAGNEVKRGCELE
jgi:hypothetical protein